MDDSPSWRGKTKDFNTMVKDYQQELSSPYVEFFYDYKGLWDVPSRCGLKIVPRADADVVIATELYTNNPGTSVTEFCNRLATLIVKDKGLMPDRLMFIVRTPDNQSKMSFWNEFFAHAIMAWDGEKFGKPQWQKMSKEEVDALLTP